MTRKAPGETLHVNQPAIARMERRADMYVSNLRGLIETEAVDREQVELESRAMAAIRMLDKTRLRIGAKQLEALRGGIEDPG